MSVKVQADFGKKITVTAERLSYEDRPSTFSMYVTGQDKLHLFMNSGSRMNDDKYGQSMIINADDAMAIMDWLASIIEPAKARLRIK